MPERILFYPGCSFETAAGYKQSLQALCSRLDISMPHMASWSCCGSTACISLQGEKGMYPAARILAQAGSEGATMLVTGCNGCFNALRKAAKLMHQDQGFKERTRERLKQQDGLTLCPDLEIKHLLQVLVKKVDAGDRTRHPHVQKLRVAAYYGCLFSRPWTDVDDPEHPQMLDRFMQELGFTPVDYSLKTACCGAAHALAFREQTEMLVERIIRSMQDKQADLAAVICPLCQLNLESAQLSLGLPRLPVLFFTQVAGLALGIPRSELGLDKLLIAPEKI
ncbi:heterodisulfide reductase-related iron-sulfur binding cluster [Desulfonatronospira sp.]|uniref:CoB--CoM heterodisulfide reductase iron-sulfur subunit B family protein n=1 Tax=Desulfonatronospira sp. TaxID=1962951 RepID=UPI0025C14F7B|nr:heterodisulfide reductase-related iron-sulfur binding cluster [Desulfonatronospira sp.]